MRFKQYVVSLAFLLFASPAFAEKKYDSGASDTEIKIGNFSPETGWLSEYAAIAHAQAAYFQMVNDNGGVNGRKIVFISRDNNSDPKKSVDIAHDLVEKEQVLLLFGTHGPSANLAIRQYMNDKKIPQLFVASPLSALNDPEHFPWTMGFQASAKTEAAIYTKYILQAKPNAKIAVLSGNDDTGKDYLAGIHEALGKDHANLIVKELTYSDKADNPDAEITALKETGADTFLDFASGKFATQAIRKIHDLDWHPLHFIPNTSISTAAFLDPAGLENARDILSSARSKGWQSAEAKRDPDVQAFLAFLKKYLPTASPRDLNNVYGYITAEALVEVLKKSGDDLTRENILKQANHLDTELPMLLPKIKLQTTPTDYRPIKQLYLIQFNGKTWTRIGDPIAG